MQEQSYLGKSTATHVNIGYSGGILYTPLPDSFRILLPRELVPKHAGLLYYSNASKKIYINSPGIRDTIYEPWVVLLRPGVAPTKWQHKQQILYHRELQLLKAFVLLNP